MKSANGATYGLTYDRSSTLLPGLLPAQHPSTAGSCTFLPRHCATVPKRIGTTSSTSRSRVVPWQANHQDGQLLPNYS